MNHSTIEKSSQKEHPLSCVAEGFLGLFLMTVFVGVYTRKMAK